MRISKACQDAVADARRVYGGPVSADVALVFELAAAALLRHRARLMSMRRGNPKECLEQLVADLRQRCGACALFDKLAGRRVASVRDVLGIIDHALNNLEYVISAAKEDGDGHN